MCSCQTRVSVFEACGHKSRRRTPCGKARLRASNFLCLGSVIGKCKSEKLRKIKFGLCGQCEAHFRPFRINDPRYVEKYMAYKQAHGLGKVDASVIPVEAIFARFDMRRLHGQSPMRAAPQHDSIQPTPDNFQLPARAYTPDHADARSDWSWSPAMAGSCVGDIHLADVDIYFPEYTVRADDGDPFTWSQRKGRAKVPGLYRGTDIKETILYVPLDDVYDFDVPVPRLVACPRTPWWRRERRERRAWSKYAKAEWTPARRPVMRSRSASWVPVPRSAHREIFRGCPYHGASRVMGCADCRANAFKEHGVPAAVDAAVVPVPEEPPRCRSAPPRLVRITHPGRGYTCAAQAICFCAELGPENCLPCSERAEQIRTLQAGFI